MRGYRGAPTARTAATMMLLVSLLSAWTPVRSTIRQYTPGAKPPVNDTGLAVVGLAVIAGPAAMLRCYPVGVMCPPW